MTFIKKLSTTLILSVAMFGLTACSEKEAEKAGDKVESVAQDASSTMDKMKDSAGNALEAAGEKVNEMKDSAGDALESAGEKVSDIKR